MLIRAPNSIPFKGLKMKSVAPARKAVSIRSCFRLPVIMMIGALL